jgi:hypothetical protein
MLGRLHRLPDAAHGRSVRENYRCVNTDFGREERLLQGGRAFLKPFDGYCLFACLRAGLSAPVWEDGAGIPSAPYQPSSLASTPHGPRHRGPQDSSVMRGPRVRRPGKGGGRSLLFCRIS